MDIKSVAVSAAKKSGKILLKLSKQKINYRLKSSHDILAEADLASEKIIIAEIKKHFPNHSILSEEKGIEIKKSDYLWVVDPLDGTINFSRGISEYCISIAIEHKKEIILGAIYQPETGDIYCAEKNKGAFLNNKKILVSKENKLINSIIATDFSSKIQTRELNFKIFLKLCNQVRHGRIFGSGALHLAKIASGKIDAYIKTQYNHWDYAAGSLLVKEAGGKATNFEGSEINPQTKTLLATNGKIHNELLKLIKNIR